MNHLHNDRDGQTVSRLIAQMERVASRNEINRILSDAEEAGQIEKLNPILYRCGSCFIYDKLRVAAERQVPVLKALNEKGFTIFPEVIKAVTYADWCIVFLNIEGMNGKDLIPFEMMRGEVDLSSRRAVYRELERLCEADLWIPWPSRGPWGWCVTADSCRIIAPLRGTAVDIVEDPAEKENILSDYRNYLFSGE